MTLCNKYIKYIFSYIKLGIQEIWFNRNGLLGKECGRNPPESKERTSQCKHIGDKDQSFKCRIESEEDISQNFKNRKRVGCYLRRIKSKHVSFFSYQ